MTKSSQSAPRYYNTKTTAAELASGKKLCASLFKLFWLLFYTSLKGFQQAGALLLWHLEQLQDLLRGHVLHTH